MRRRLGVSTLLVSLGASRGRLIRHVLAESMMLSLGGGLIGVFVAWWTGSLMLPLIPESLPMAGVSTDPTEAPTLLR